MNVKFSLFLRINIAVHITALLLLSIPLGAQASRTLYIATNGSDSNDGSINNPLATLNRAEQLVNFANGDHTIYIRGGTYGGVSVSWEKFSPTYHVTIAAYGNERPVFDGISNGSMKSYFFRLYRGQAQCSNITIRGLTIRHYLNYGIFLQGVGSTAWQGCNIIEKNTLEENGDLYLPPGYSCGGSRIGYGAIAMSYSRNNIIRNNTIVNSEDCQEYAAYMHAVYVSHRSTGNQVYNNYISMTSGDPLRVRNAANNNEFYDNYVDRSGASGCISGYTNTAAGEQPSSGNVIDNNVITFPYPDVSSIELICNVCDTSTFIDNGQRYFHGDQAIEQVGAIASGDFNGDGESELLVALNYTSSSPYFPSFVKVVKTSGGDNPHLHYVVYISSSFEIHAMAAGNYDGAGNDEVLTFFRHRADGQTRIYRGNGSTSLVNQRIYDSYTWSVSAMTGGDFDGDGADEVIASLYSPSSGENRIYSGNGMSSILDNGMLYASLSWRIPAMTAADFNGDGKDELFSAFNEQATSRIYKGNGTTSVIDGGYLYSSTSFTIPAITAGGFAGSGSLRLVTAFKSRSDAETRIYNGSLASPTGTRIYSSTVWNVSDLAAGQFSPDESEELMTAFTWPTRTQISSGNGTTSAVNEKLFHRWP